MKRVMSLFGIGLILVTISCWLPEFDGDILWTKELDIFGSNELVLGTNGDIYYVGENKIVALDRDGNLMWSFDTDTLTPYTPSVGSDGTIYFGSNCNDEEGALLPIGVLFAVSPDNQLIWRKEFDAGVGTPLIGPDGTLYVTSRTSESFFGTLFALDKDGNTLWNLHDVSGVNAIGNDGTIYCSHSASYCSVEAEHLAAVSSDGEIQWEIGIDHCVYDVAIADDGTLYVESLNYMQAINPDGNEMWSNGLYSSPVVDVDNTVYVTDSDFLYAVDDQGEEIWKYEFKSKADFCSPGYPCIGADGTIYCNLLERYAEYGHFSDYKSSIYAFESDGDVKWVYENPDSAYCYSYCLSDDGVLFFISYSNGNPKQLVALQTESMGLALSSWPCEMADFQNTGRVK